MTNYPLSQFFTPAWAGEILFDSHFSHLTSDDLVWEPSCGTGNLLSAIPEHINCIGTEIDAELATKARINTGRRVIVGDCRSVEFEGMESISAVFGNPPFNFNVFACLLQRCSRMLKIGQKAGFVLPAYFLQTSKTVMVLSEKWRVEQEIIPRDIFPNLSKPLIFGIFTRDTRRKLIGFRLFSECCDMKTLDDKTRRALSDGIVPGYSVWKNTIAGILTELGGSAPLSSIYGLMEGRHPTENNFWKEQTRKVLQKSFTRIKEGVYSLPN